MNLRTYFLALMKIKLVSIFVVVTLGSAEWERTTTVPEICKMDPVEGEGRAKFPGWFYDKNIDSCLPLTFGAPKAVNEIVNRFETKKNCSITCRPHVKSFCFDDVPTTSEGEPNSKWSYNSTQGKCIMVSGKQKKSECTNVFDSEAECITTCRDPDYGPCAKPLPKDCKETDTDHYRYNIKTERCFHDTKWKCGGENKFVSLKDCYKRCGRFIQDKCKHRPQDISNWCSTNGHRYYYNKKANRCNSYYRCDDHGIGFFSLKECNETCLS
uniref:Putative salivary kunitz domain protein n=1 Tax=Ixodes ricinus TaxID=34613 RepID=A0A0K8RG22_IXORI